MNADNSNGGSDQLSSLPFEVTDTLAFKYWEALRKMANTSDNIWFAGVTFEHSPTQAERTLHFRANGDMKAFRDHFFEEYRASIHKPQEQPQTIPV